MSLILNSTLQTQLDGTTRHPIVKIISESFADPIPFEGNSFAFSDSDYWDPDLARLSTEQLVIVANSGAGDGIIKLYMTDVTRSYWTQYDIQTTRTTTQFEKCTVVEMTNGDLLIVYQWSTGSTEYIEGWICDINGNNVSSSPISIDSFASAEVLFDSYVMYDSDAQLYYVFYTYETSATPTYTLAYRSSSNGTTWGSENSISLTGISNTKIIKNIHAMQSSDDDIIISFQYEYDTDPVSDWTVYNTYYAVSQDNCSTWSTPTQVTTFTAWGESAEHPQVEIKDNATVYFTFSERAGVSYFDHNTASVLSDSNTGYVYPSQCHFYNNWIYIVSIYPHTGVKELSGMYVVDPSDMSLVKQYTQTTSPGFTASLWQNENARLTLTHGDEEYMAAASSDIWGTSGLEECKGVIAVATYDGVTDQVVEYVFNGDLDTYSLDKNVTATEHTEVFGSANVTVGGCAVDATNDRLYVMLYSTLSYAIGLQIGYIDLTESPDINGQYSWNDLYCESASDICSAFNLTESDYKYCIGNPFEFRYCSNNDVLIFTGNTTVGDDKALTLIMNASTGVVQTVKAYENDSRFPFNGLNNAYVYDNILYGDFTYQNSYGQGNYYGLFVWDMITDTVRLDRPNYAIQDNYYFHDVDFADISNSYIWFASTDGTVRYNVSTQNFDLYDDDSVPGYGGAGWSTDTNYTKCIAVNTGSSDIYAGSNVYNYWDGVRKFNPNGAYYIGQYATGTKSGTSLGLGTINDLTINTNEEHIAITSDEDNIFWAFWNHEDITNSVYDIHWGKDVGSVTISDDLMKGSAVQIVWDVEYPSTLMFTCGRGHLYDPLNVLSSLNYLFNRGRKITVQFGENISDTEYWHNQGTFIVEETELTYKRGNHPEITVSCCDFKRLWSEHRIVMTDYYDGQLPDVIIEDLLDDWTILESADYDISSFTNEHTVWTQFSDIGFWEVIQTILDHFGYIGHIDVDGVFVNLEVDFDKAVDHTYSDTTHIENLSPQSNYGSFINQVTVIGETHDDIEVLYEAEQVTSKNGTLGWWNQTEEHTIYYSADRTVIGRNPYLDVQISLADFQYFVFKGGGTEYISEVDVNNRYCVVTLEGPNLIGVVVGLAVAVVALGYMASECTIYCGPFIYATNVMISLLIYAICAVANYAFNIWVQPIGHMKQTVQFTATDTEMQDALNGQTIAEEIEDPLCYNVTQCQMVAEHELSVAKYQRNRLKFRKLAHLQDEILDKLSVVHPFSNQALEVIVTNLTRTLTIGGEMMDEIEGWRTN